MHRSTGQAGRGRRGDVRPGVRAEQPEEPGCLRAERAVRPGEHGPYVGRRVRAGERFQPAPWSRSCRANAASAKSGYTAARAATIASASGNPAHAARISPTGSGSAATRPGPRRRASSSSASASVSRPRVTGWAPSVVIRPMSWSRLVTSTRHPGEPGSSGRTWSASRALSSTTSTRRPATRLRYSAAWASRSAGIRSGGTANASRKPRTASAGAMTDPVGSNPRRFTYSCPSGIARRLGSPSAAPSWSCRSLPCRRSQR